MLRVVQSTRLDQILGLDAHRHDAIVLLTALQIIRLSSTSLNVTSRFVMIHRTDSDAQTSS